MKGFKIFQHALGMVFRNWLSAIRIVIVPFVLFVALTFGLGWIFPLPVEGTTDELGGMSLSMIAFVIILFIVGVWMMIWVAVAWHRLVLLEEPIKGLLPTMHRGPMGAYFGKAAQIVLVVFLFFMALGVVLVIMSKLLGAFISFVPIIVMLLSPVIMRLMLMLPGAAVGNKMTIDDAWSATYETYGTFLTLAVITVLFFFALSFVAGGVMLVSPVLGFILQPLISFLSSLVNLSILTTLYGHYIEGRELV